MDGKDMTMVDRSNIKRVASTLAKQGFEVPDPDARDIALWWPDESITLTLHHDGDVRLETDGGNVPLYAVADACEAIVLGLRALLSPQPGRTTSEERADG